MDLLEHQSTRSGNVNRHPWELARLRILSFLIKPYAKNKILDIGSGDAFLASELAKANPQATVVGVDINYNVEIVKRLFKSKPANLYLQKDLKEAKKHLDNKTDVVVMMDVLEHIQEPNALLHSIASNFIIDNTVYIITVPAFQSLFSEHDRKLGHVKRYNLKTLNLLLEQNQLHPISIGYAFNTLVIIRKMQLLIEKITKKDTYESTGIHNWKVGRFLSSCMTLFFWIEFKISWYLSKIGINVPGLTCYCICRRLPL